MLEYVKEEHLNPNLTEAVEQFKNSILFWTNLKIVSFPLSFIMRKRYGRSNLRYFKWEEYPSGRTQGPTGKNIFAGKSQPPWSPVPRWNISFHVRPERLQLDRL